MTLLKTVSTSLLVFASAAAWGADVQQMMRACAEEYHLAPPSPGQPPSDSDRQKMESCMKAKGVSELPPPPTSSQSATQNSSSAPTTSSTNESEPPSGALPDREVVMMCTESVGISRYTLGRFPTAEERKKIDACIRNTQSQRSSQDRRNTENSDFKKPETHKSESTTPESKGVDPSQSDRH